MKHVLPEEQLIEYAKSYLKAKGFKKKNKRWTKDTGEFNENIKDEDFGSAFFDAMKELAEDIATENGLVYKLWTENEKTQEAGGIYVFDNLNDANRYLEKHTQRLTSFGFKDIKSKVFVINEALSTITKASL